MKKKKCSLFILFLFFLVFALAQLILGVELEEQYDYTDFNNYQDANFYEQIEWNQVPPEMIFKIPPEYLDYAQLSSEQRVRMTSEQIAANFDNIGDLMRDVNQETAIEAIENTYHLADFEFSGYTFDEQGARIENDVLMATFGEEDHITLSNDNYLDGFIEITSQGKIIFRPPITPVDLIPELDIPDTDRFTLDTRGTTVEYDGHLINGDPSFREGRLYLIDTSSIEIDNIVIRNFNAHSEVAVFLDNSKYEGSFVSLVPGEDIIINAATTGFSVFFLSGNDFIPVSEGTSLGIAPSQESRITITDRSAEGLRPEIVFQGEGGNIFNGIDRYTIDSGRIEGVLNEPYPTVPLTLILQDQNGDNLLGEKIIFDNGGNFAIVSLLLPAEEMECLDCRPDLNTLMYDHYYSQFEALGIELEVPDDPFLLRDAYDLLMGLTPEMRDSVEGLEVSYFESGLTNCGFGSAAGCAFPDGDIWIESQYLEDSETLSHEVGHTRTFEIESNEKEWILERYILDLAKKHGSIGAIPEDDWEWAQERAEEYYEDNSFEGKWESNAGDPYGRGFGIRHIFQGSILEIYPDQWSDGFYGPRYGCFNAYGCNNFYEDVATTVENVVAYPEEAANMINPESDYYQDQIGGEIGDTGVIMTQEIADDWAQRLRGRVDLLYEYNFITEQQYRTIVPK